MERSCMLLPASGEGRVLRVGFRRYTIRRTMGLWLRKPLIALIVSLLVVVAALPATGASSRAEPAGDWRSDWALTEGFDLDLDTDGYEFPTAIAFVPHPVPARRTPRYFVTELQGRVRVVANDRSVHLFAERFFPLTPQADPSQLEGQSGMAGICLDPAHGYVFVTYAYQDADHELHNNITRFETEPNTFALAPRSQRALTNIFDKYDAAPSHQIGNCQVSGDFLYVSVADGGRPRKPRTRTRCSEKSCA